MISVAVTEKSNVNPWKMTNRTIRRLALGSVLRCVTPPYLKKRGFQLLADLGSSKHFIDEELIRGVESRMQECTRIEPPMEITTAVNNVLRGTAQGILLVIVRGTDDALRQVKLPIVLVPKLKRKLFSSLAAAKKGVKAVVKRKYPCIPVFHQII